MAALLRHPHDLPPHVIYLRPTHTLKEEALNVGEPIAKHLKFRGVVVIVCLSKNMVNLLILLQCIIVLHHLGRQPH